MSAPVPTKRRVAALRERRAEAGLVRVELWVRPEHADELRVYAQWLQQRTGRDAARSKAAPRPADRKPAVAPRHVPDQENRRMDTPIAWADQPQGTVAAAFRDWRALPSALDRILRLAGFDEGTTGIMVPGARAAAARARWVDPNWERVDVSRPLERPRLYWARKLEVTGPAGTALGVLLR